MKKGIRILIGTLVSLVLTTILLVSISMWFVFTPKRITPFVLKQAASYLQCQANINSVELTFFSTFPNFGIKIDQLDLINPTPGSPNDTLVSIDELHGIVDLKALWKSNEILLRAATLSNGTITIYTDSLGFSNYDIFPVDTTNTTTPKTESAPINIDLEHIQFNNINFSYINNTMPIVASCKHFTGNIQGQMRANVLNAKVNIENTIVSLNYGNQEYLISDTIQLETSFAYALNPMKLNIDHTKLQVNTLPLAINGLIATDTLQSGLMVNLTYQLGQFTIPNLFKLIPPTYQSYTNQISANGSVTINGSIKGLFTDSLMPMFTTTLAINDGQFAYNKIPLNLHAVNGNIELVTDTKTDDLTFLTIHQLEAKTDQSAFNIQGKVKQLFGDIHCQLSSKFNLDLNEFAPFIPQNIDLNIAGKAQGKLQTSCSLSQLETMQFNKIKLNGSLALSNINAQYDTLWINSSNTKIDFSLPNSHSQNPNTKFLKLKLETEQLTAGATKNYQSHLETAIINIETSNLLDSTRIPDIICAFNIDSLTATIDTIHCNIANPEGKLILTAANSNALDPEIDIQLKTAKLNAQMGNDKVRMNQCEFSTSLRNNSEQKDLISQWLPNGFIAIETGYIETALLAYPLEIPMIKMDFTPNKINIHESALIIDKSDFQLKGSLHNVHAYFKSDSILQGDFKFTSQHTNVDQLMQLTSGIGQQDEPVDTLSETEGTGPYMVPKGIDIRLSTKIKEATYGTGNAKNINGNVLINNGVLTLDDLHLKTPATRIQLTAIYRTPRKNHLYMGLDYHMLDIEIEELLRMVPDIDTLVPMLRSFKGKGEYHMAIETYLDSAYNIKKSTIRGAASITGQDLVLMDGETFSEIAKTLKFKKRTENKVDSLSAEFTIFKNEIDVYPFLIVMDKYKAIVAGRHNFDMSFDYHISLIDSPLPLKLGIDVKGTLDNLSYRLAPCRYAQNYRPFAQRRVENKQLELRKMIRQSLIEKVTEDTE